jgi:uncharacterized protein YecT (DUF1311 family)
VRRLVLVLPVPALLTPAGLKGQGIICDEIFSTVRLNACLDGEYAKADSQLNGVYQNTLAALATDTAQRATLVRSQQAWLVYRDREREVHEAFAGGENPHRALMWSMIRMVWNRMRFFYTFAKDRYPPGEGTSQYVRF